MLARSSYYVAALDIEHAILCDYAAITNDGKLVAVGIFSGLVVGELPAAHPRMSLALRLRIHPGEDPEHRLKVRLVDPDGQPIVPDLECPLLPPEIDPSTGGFAQLVLDLSGVVFRREGPHAFDIFIDGRYERGVPLVVRKGALQQEGALGQGSA